MQRQGKLEGENPEGTQKANSTLTTGHLLQQWSYRGTPEDKELPSPIHQPAPRYGVACCKDWPFWTLPAMCRIQHSDQKKHGQKENCKPFLWLASCTFYEPFSWDNILKMAHHLFSQLLLWSRAIFLKQLQPGCGAGWKYLSCLPVQYFMLYIYTRIYMHIHIYTHIYVFIYIYIHTYIKKSTYLLTSL